jgi:retron-type reverse transcriptase
VAASNPQPARQGQRITAGDSRESPTRICKKNAATPSNFGKSAPRNSADHPCHSGTSGYFTDDYEANLDANLGDLLARIKSGRHVAPPVRRHYIPKADGTERPLGIPTLEDKVAQRAILLLLEPVYEPDFLPCSFGFRPGRSAHDALHALRNGFMEHGLRWVVDVDISKYLDPVSYCPLVDEVQSKSSDCRPKTLMRSPFCLPRVT